MAIIRWYDRPDFSPMERLQREMNRAFSDFFGKPSPMHAPVFPPVNLSEDEENFYLRSELPGVKPEDLDISEEGETVTLRGERKLAKAGENVSYHRRERESGRFRRTISLSARIDPERVNALFIGGVLKITLPKAKETLPTQIKIKSE
jgi:HSP20 family protein